MVLRFRRDFRFEFGNRGTNAIQTPEKTGDLSNAKTTPLSFFPATGRPEPQSSATLHPVETTRTSYFEFSRPPCGYNNTARLAVRVVLLYEAEMEAEVDMRTIDVFTGKLTLLLPAGTVTLEGTVAAALLLESVTCAPPAGAAPLSVTVPVDDCTPPTTLVGFNVSEETVGRGGGITVSEADVLVPP